MKKKYFYNEVVWEFWRKGGKCKGEGENEDGSVCVWGGGRLPDVLGEDTSGKMKKKNKTCRE